MNYFQGDLSKLSDAGLHTLADEISKEFNRRWREANPEEAMRRDMEAMSLGHYRPKPAEIFEQSNQFSQLMWRALWQPR